MNVPIDHSKDASPDPVHEATEALQHLAEEVERERAERGRSDLDQIHLSDGEELATSLGAPGPDPNHDADAPAKDAPGTDGRVGLAEEGTDGTVPVQNGMKNPH
ncbi:hypothetical protein LGT39_03240 [Demequina sp. TTPB684]|uniref:hypothetical protein n=1 Tax=unclassified Demequina TaxID=2620311 RepID=UPI001CF49DB8|nr:MULTISPECIES: hypothetical protein [unclassified Demequina]MCB2411865.1 hypothetical protein [Demequina sp. TTPB684]UPU88619.1 hypothetical protein LGT36_001470 [Demequina sp. TMPB413]